MNLSRHEIRVKALQSLFPLDGNQDMTKAEAIKYALEYGEEELISEDHQSFVPDYLDRLVTGVCEKQKDLDEKIKEHLKGWTLQRIAKVDLIILRIATYELMYENETPQKVVLDEAIELTREFNDDVSRRFVNGVLSNIANDIQTNDSKE